MSSIGLTWSEVITLTLHPITLQLMTTLLDRSVGRSWCGPFRRIRTSLLPTILCVSALSLSLHTDATAQVVDPERLSLAGSTIARHGVGIWSLTDVEERSTSVSRARFGSSFGSLGTTTGLSLFVPIGRGTLLFGMLRGMTVESYREIDGSIGSARRIGSFHAALEIHLNAVAIESYGSSFEPTIDVAILMPITPEVTFGTNATNVTGSAHADHDLPWSLGAGVALRPDSVVTLSLDALLESNAPLSFRAGLSWDPLESLSLRCGLGSTPSRVGLGLGLQVGSYEFDIGSEYRTALGLRHAFGGGVRW